jgi:hypothetical protein
MTMIRQRPLCAQGCRSGNRRRFPTADIALAVGQAILGGERSFDDAMNKGTVEPQAVIRSRPTFV